MTRLPTARLMQLRDELQRRGQRRSMVFPSAAPNVVEVMSIAEEYGALCEVMFLVMMVERKMLNVQRSLAGEPPLAALPADLTRSAAGQASRKTDMLQTSL